MTLNRSARIKSAAFLRGKGISLKNDRQNYFHALIVSQLPVSESRFTMRGHYDQDGYRKSQRNCERVHTARTSQSKTSQIWRQVHSTRSQFRLQSLERGGVAQEPVRKNLLEKVDRIKSKHDERQVRYEKCVNLLSRKTLQRSRLLQEKGQRGEIGKKIHEVLIPIEKAKLSSEERYRARLLKIRKY